MRAIVALIAGIIGVVAGWVIGAAATIAFGEHFGLSNFEGQRDIMAAFAVGPVCGLIGLIAGLWLSLRWTRG